jgi:HEAT repeat protein
MLTLLLAPLLLWAPHGGQYLPPAPDHGTDPIIANIVSQPGLGPELEFTAGRWEWWLDFNAEPLLDLRRRLAVRAQAVGSYPWRGLTKTDRGSVVLPALVDALRKQPARSGGVRRHFNNRDVRAAAVLALGRLQIAEAVPFIEYVIDEDPDLFVRTQAVLALGFSDSSSAVETLVHLFHDEKQGEEIRSYAVVGLGLIGNPQAVDELAGAVAEKPLKQQGNQLRAAILYAAGLAGHPSLAARLRALSGTWLFKKEASVRALVATALGRIDDPASIPFLIEQLRDADNQVRRSAAAALEGSSAQLDDASVARLISHFEADADAPARYNLLRALGNARLDGSREFLRDTLRTATYSFRPHVALALAIDGDPGNAAFLLAALEQENEQSAQSALIISLGILGARSATEPLLELFREKRDPALLGYLCLALGLINPPQTDFAELVDEIIRESNSVELLRSATIAIGLLGDRQRVADLTAALPQIGGTIRRASLVHGLGLVGDRSTIPALIKLLDDPSQPSYVRAYALQALGELSDPRELSPAWRLSSHVEMNHDVGFLFEMYRVL